MRTHSNPSHFKTAFFKVVREVGDLGGWDVGGGSKIIYVLVFF